MTDQNQGHAPFDELAAGHVLHSLEPADEQQFLEHAGGCPQCLDALAGFRDVAAALAETAPAAEPSPQLGARIMAAVLGDLPISNRSTGPAADLLRLGSAAGPARTSGPGLADTGAQDADASGPGTGTADQPHARTPDTAAGQPGTGTADQTDVAPGADAGGPGTGTADQPHAGIPDASGPGTGTADGTAGAGGADASGADTGTTDQPHAGTSDADASGAGTGTAGEAEAGAAGVVVPLHRRTMPRWLRPAAVAAAAALIAGGGVWAGLDATSSHPSPVANCLHERGCAEVALAATGTHRQAAKVLVLDGAAWIMPVSMRADNTADQIYVLWQIIGKLPPRAIGSFDVHSGSTAAIKIGKLSAPYRGTVFAVSLEHGRKIPPAPTVVVAAS